MKQSFIFLALIVALAGCRGGKLPVSEANADLLYEKHHYYDAAQMFEKLLKKEKDEEEIKTYTEKLADCYMQISNFQSALVNYRKVMDFYPDKPEYIYIYADLLMSNDRYEEALGYLETYQKEVPGDKRTAKKMAICKQAISINVGGSRFNVTTVADINSRFNDYCPSVVDGDLYFTSDRSGSTGGQRYEKFGNYYADIYQSEINGLSLSNARQTSGSVNTNENEGTTAFNGQGNVMIFTRCHGAGFDSTCALMVSTRDGGNWKKPEAIEFSMSDAYMYGHPTLSEDGKTLIFSSNMPGGYGGHDLYVSRKQGGRWSKPENLGPKVNSGGDEMFPYLLDDKTLYFSSNGHAGFGALDIFVSINKKDRWRNPENLLPPINSGGDDFGICYDRDNPEMSNGYFTSNRRGSQGDDIYRFDIVTPPLCTVCGTVYDNKTKKALGQSTVYLTDLGTGKPVYTMTDRNGQYCMKLLYERDYMMDAYKKYYANNQPKPRFDTRNLNFQKKFRQDFYLDKWTIEEIEIEGILYDLNSAELRPESKEILDSLSSILTIHYYLVVELSSHTDCRGTVEYNDNLSQQRAESCVNYLIGKGIPKERIVPKGYGEHRLLNDCACEGEEGKGLDCTEEQHQQNRRTSFQILRTDFERSEDAVYGEPYSDPEGN